MGGQYTGMQDQEFDPQELDDEQLEQMSGGVGRKLLCSGGTIRVCGTINGVYKCRCEPKVAPPAPAEEV